MTSIAPQELANWIKADVDFQLIDVREPHEHADFNLGGTLIPMDELWRDPSVIDMEKPVVLYCHHGIRSQIMIQRLEQKFGWQHLLNLTGGTHAWQQRFGNQLV